MRQNGALELRFIIYAFRMAATSKEAQADPAIKAAVSAAVENIGEWVARFPLRKGTSPLRLLPTYEQWALDILGHGEFDDYWKQRGYAISHYYEEHADVPTLYLGGWYDSYARATCENFRRLKALKKSPQALLMGPWTHGGWGATNSGDLDFGVESLISYNDLRLAWLDRYLKGLNSEAADWPRVRIFVMGSGTGRLNPAGRIDHGGAWRDETDYPLPGTQFTPFYLLADGGLTTQPPDAAEAWSSFTYDPSDPVPTIGGGISAADPIMLPGGFDQRGDRRFFGCKDRLPLNARNDVLTFQTEPLDRDTEVTGPITVRLFASSSAPDTDFTAKLIDVFPPSADFPAGLAVNLTDSILRARYRNGWERPEMLNPGTIYELHFELYPTSNVFRAGHGIRLDVSSSNFPRFDVNPNTGGPLGRDRRTQVAEQRIYHDLNHPSCIMLPRVER
jgi:putative CocE/NonD family hydrolase